ncbi:MAG: NADH-quinone oxidoreductase subunit NuoG [bacterium]
MPTVTIDGKTIEVEPGTTIIQAADALGIYIPRFCYHPKLSVVAQCRQCMVEIQQPAPPPGAPPRPFTACSTPVGDGMVVSTTSEVAVQAQKAVVEFLLINHPLDCPICDQGGECPLQDITMGFGESLTRNEFLRRTYPKVDISPFIEPEMNRCIHCTRCIRFSEEIDGASEFGFVDRGDRTLVDVYHDLVVSVKSTVSGNVIDLCPVGALTNKPYRFKARVWEMEETETPCLLCPVQCASKVWTRENDIKRVTAGHNEAVNECWICDAGRWGMEFVGSAGRPKAPMIGRGQKRAEAAWEEAAFRTADSLRRIRETHGPEAIAGIGGARSTNEAAYLFQKLLRGVLGTNHVDARTHPLDTAATDALVRTRGYPGLSLGFEDLEEAPSAFLIGSDLFYEHPILALRLRKALKAGKKLVLAHPRRVSLNVPETVRLQYAPGADRALLLGLWAALKEQRADLSVPPGADAPPGDLAEAAGVSPDDLRRSAEIVGGDDGCVLLMGPGVGDPSAASLFAALEAALPEARGGYLHTAPNLEGAMDMGCLPYAFPGYRPVGEDRDLSEASVLRYPEWRGLDTDGILAAAREGRIKALYLLGADPLRDMPDPQAVREALGKLELLIVQDALPNLCSRFADITLPSRTATEMEGTVTGVGRHVQPLRVAVQPHPGTRPEWEVLQELIHQMGALIGPVSLKAVQEEIGRVIPAYSGVCNGGLKDGGFRWPVEALAGGRVEVPVSGEGASPVKGVSGTGGAGGQGLRLLTSPQLFSSGPMVAESKAIRAAGPQAYAELHPDTASSLGIADGESVRLSSPKGTISVAVRVDGKTPPGAVYVPWGAGETPSNGLLSADDFVPTVTLEKQAL